MNIYINSLICFDCIVLLYIFFFFLDAGEEALFLSIKHNLLEALKADTVEWRRSFGRPLKLVRLGGTFVPFSSNTLPTIEKNFQLIKQPIFHIYWSECSVSFNC